MQYADDNLHVDLMQESAEDFYEQAPCGYCSCLPDGKLIKLNHTLLTWLGYSQEDLVGRRSLQELFTIGGGLHLELYGMPLLLLQGYVRELSYQLRHQDNTHRPVLLTATLLRDTEGKPLVVRVTLFDITDRRQYERELLRAKQLADDQRAELAKANAALTHANELLTRTNTDLDTFIYMASHDLRAPITNIEGLLKLLARQLPSEVVKYQPVANVFDLLKTSVDRFTTTIQQLTDITRLQQAQTLANENVDLTALLDDICLDLAPQLAAAAAQLTVEVDRCSRLFFARKHLRSILYNLLSNGIKYRHPDRPAMLQVRCYPVGDLVRLEVQDNGLGLREDQQNQIFGLFQRLHDHVEGTGVGLYTVKRIVENAKGTITVQSKPDVGSTFCVVLPADMRY